MKSSPQSFATALSRFLTIKVITRVSLVAVGMILLTVITETGFTQKRGDSNSHTVRPDSTKSANSGGGVGSSQLTLPVVSPQDRLVPVVRERIEPIRMNKDLRELPQIPINSGFELPEFRRHPRVEDDEESSSEESAPTQFGALLELLAPTPTMPGLNFNFEGMDLTASGCSCSPPDTDGDIGANHFIQMVNSGAFKIWDKTGTTLLATTNLNTLWGTGGTNPCTQGKHFGDGVVFYDHVADRWILTDFAFGTSGPNTVAPYYQCTAISQTSNPISGGWFFYAVQHDSANPDWIGDYPKFGMWPDAYYSGYNMFCGASSCTFGGRNSFQGIQVVAYDRSKMILGLAMTPIMFRLTPAQVGDTYTLIPATFRFGTPPVGRNEFFASIDSPPVANALSTLNKVHLWKFHVDFTTPANSTFTGPTDVTVNGFTNAWDSTENAAIVPQSGTSSKLDTVGDRLFANLWYQNLGGIESLWATHTINATSVAPTAVRWYQFDVTGNTVATSPVQQGDINGGGDGLYRWMPSLAVDKNGDMAIGYSVSSGSTFPSIRYNGRLTTDTLNTLGQGESTMVNGTGAFTGSTRWGDYSATSIDPVNGCTFWHTNEYMLSGSTSNWKTRIGSFAFAPCAGTGTLTGTVTDASTSSPISGATVTAGSNVTTTNASGVYTFNGITADIYNVTVSATGYASATHSGVTVTSGGTTTENFALSATAACGGANVWCSVTNTTGALFWSTASTWDKGTVPAAGADVIIRAFSGAYSNGNFVALNGSANVHSITIQTNANAGVGGTGGTETFTVSGDFAMQSGSLLRDVLWTGGAQTWTLRVGGNFINDGTMGGVSTGAKYGATLEFNGGAAQTVGGSGGIRALSGNGAGAAPAIVVSNTSAGGVTFSNNVNTTNAGGVVAPVTINSGATVKFASSGIQFTGGGSLALNGLTELQAATFNGHYAMTGTRTIGTGSTITYKNTASTITPTTDIPAATVGNLIIDSSAGSATLGANLTISGNLIVNTGTFNLQNFTANRSAGGGTLTVVNGATLKIGGTNAFPTNYSTHTLGAVSTVEYGGTNQTVTNESYGNLTLSGSGTKTMPAAPMAIASNLSTSGTNSATAGAAITISGNVTLGSGTTFNAGSFTHNVAGDWTNNGAIFGPSTGTVNFNSSAVAQAINGTASSQTFNNITVNKAAQTLSVGGNTTTLTLNGNLLISTGGFTAPATLNIAGNFTNDGVFNHNGGTATFNSGTGAQTIGGSNPTTFNALSINNGAGVSLSQNVTVNGVLSLNGDLTTTTSFVLTENGTSSGTGDVVGTVRRMDVNATAKSFGNPNVQIANGGTATTVDIDLAKGAPGGFATAVSRGYSIVATGGTVSAATVRLHYLDSELNGNAEGSLTLWRVTSNTWTDQGFDSRDTGANWVEKTGVAGFSEWTLAAAPSAPTAVKLTGFTAREKNGEVRLQWQSGYEARNLGYNIYREQDGQRVAITPSLVAGSALIAGAKTKLTAGLSYTWYDEITTAGGQQSPVTYWLEDVDLNGTRTLHGPI
ncbi:MAG TPA: carboxypeptidase regulatory-like domain-containing protein, partial [Pyrinomonadaceae bacterium]